MRSTVKKPAPLPHPALLNPTAYYAAQAKSSNPRLIRALAVPKSTAVSRFNPAAASTVVKRTTSLAVKPQPEPVNHAATPAPSLEARIENTVDNLFAQALGQATSHEQPQPVKMKLRHRAATRLGLSAKTLGMSASVLAVLLLGGFFALQNVPNVSMRIASARAGVHGTLPGYTPSGFALAGPIKYGNGSITVSFHSNSDSRAFQVTEQTSEWNSDALLDSYVGVNNRPYQTFSANGRTVYIYNDSDASWVDGGVWYKIEGNSSLSSDQLLHIAESI